MPVHELDEKQIATIAARERIDPALVRDIGKAAAAHDVSPTLLLAVAKRETDFGRGSGYDERTGRGDSGHGYGMFQLDDRTPAHAPYLTEVQHDPARAADVAAAMISESLASGTPALDAMHIYNAGSLDRPSTKGIFEGRTVPYETAVMGWAREYDAAGHAMAPVAAHAVAPAAAERKDATPADQTLVNARIAEAAEKLRGMSTRDAQTHTPQLEDGNLGCAYSVNKVLDTALGRTYGANPDYVPSVMADLQRHGSPISASDVRAGDVAIKLPSNGETHGHIGIVTRGGESPLILNNSSREGALSREDTPQQFSRNYKTHRDEDRVIYLRVDPTSVDLGYVRSNPIADRVLGPDAAPPDPTHWTERRPTSASDQRHPAAHDAARHAADTPAPTASDRPLDGGPPRHDLKINGELRGGHLVETPQELARKNAIMAEAAGDARRGETLDFHFIGNGRETAREVALQNEKLQQAIATNLPPNALPHLVAPAEHAGRWTPDMPFEQFEKLMSRARGGNAHAPESEVARPRAPERAPDLGR